MKSMLIDDLLEQAKNVCEKHGARFTPAREQVFKILAEHGGAIGAYDLLDQLKEVDPAAKPATIYRALDFLGKQGFVHKIESINAFVMCHHLSQCHHPVQILICDSCDYVEEVQSNELDTYLKNMAKSHGFAISHQTIEAHGTCKNCQ